MTKCCLQKQKQLTLSECLSFLKLIKCVFNMFCHIWILLNPFQGDLCCVNMAALTSFFQDCVQRFASTACLWDHKQPLIFYTTLQPHPPPPDCLNQSNVTKRFPSIGWLTSSSKCLAIVFTPFKEERKWWKPCERQIVKFFMNTEI